MSVISRKEAKALGLVRYFTGKPCPNGHVSERMVSNKCCAVCCTEYARKWAVDNPGRNKERWRAWDQSNKTRRAEISSRYAKANPEKRKELRRNWQKLNPEKCRANTAARRAMKTRSDGKYTPADIERLKRDQRGKCAYPWCRKSIKDAFHIDHIMPLVLGGSNARENIQLLCPPCNRKKWAKDPIRFAQENGRLL